MDIIYYLPWKLQICIQDCFPNQQIQIAVKCSVNSYITYETEMMGFMLFSSLITIQENVSRQSNILCINP